jgi:hypothetical protein
MDKAELQARFIIHREMDDPKNFDINQYLKTDEYFEGYPKEKEKYIEKHRKIAELKKKAINGNE